MSPRIRGRTAVLVALVLLVATAVAAGASPSGPAQTGNGDLEVDPDQVVMAVDLDEAGDARWRMEYRIALTTDEEVAAFEELQADIEANASAYVDRHRERMARTAADGETATGRTMAIENVSVATERRFVDREYGIVTYRFTWTNFARVDGSQLHAGDALVGLFLTENTDLVVRWPAGYDRVEVAPEPTTADDRSIRWNGPVEFDDDEPRVVVSSDAGDGAGLPWLLVGAVLLVAVAAVGGAYYLRGGSSDGIAGDDGAVPDAELLSNEEQVLRLIEDRGGRLKQQEVAEALDWTDAKTSKVVRSLREEGELEGFRLGRENVLRLPEAEEP